MSTEEKEKFDRIDSDVAKDVAAFKRWWPLLAGVFGAFCFVVGVAVSATNWFDHNVATKQDVTETRKENRELNQKMIERIDKLSASFDSHIESGKISKAHTSGRIDSVGRVVIAIEKRLNGHFVTERYLNGRNHDPVLIPTTN